MVNQHIIPRISPTSSWDNYLYIYVAGHTHRHTYTFCQLLFYIFKIVKCTWHKHLNQFQVHSAMVLIICTFLCNRYLELFILQDWNFLLTEHQLPISSSPSALGNHILLSVSMSLTNLDTSCKWNLKRYLCFYDWLFSLNVLVVHPCCTVW